ncbi:hypothetical protein [Iningainema tapete]|uniref:Uncharacterized protein n=1 Tax=Iningainema tapete BLCC-T55 TaxID=2748662 RepID=A0A8J7BW52_9CYAN|nr:hypothetical protein [Iningainema tapete]MBD2771137.1 hypothetical protein [Iningainema tapete BLCC-T55]
MQLYNFLVQVALTIVITSLCTFKLAYSPNANEQALYGGILAAVLA